MPNDAALPSVQQHAAELQKQLLAEGKIQPEGAAAPAQVPEFSKGTASVDGSTPPPAAVDFKETKVGLPEQTETTGSVPPPATAAAPPAVAPEAPSAPQTTATAASAVAADAAAAQVQQAVEDLEDWEFEDPDLNVKIPLKFPKQYSQTVKRAFPRRADYNRLKTYWGEAAPVLEPLIADGRIRQLLPLIQRALADPNYGEYVWNGYQRVQQGLPPMVQQAIQEVARAAAAPQAPSTPAEESIEDPWLQAAIAPHLQKFQTLEQKLQTFEQRDAERQRREAEQQQQQMASAQQMMLAHQDLERYYPQSFRTANGPNDPHWQNALKTAKDYGYIDSYGLRAGIVFGAQKWMELEAERIAATTSPAAQTLQAIDQRALELAQRQATDAARVVGGGAPMASTPPPPMPRPSTKNPDGSLKDKDQYLREVAAWIQSSQPAS